MNTTAIVEHYHRDDLGQVILGALTAAGKDIERLSPDDLAPVDEFHTRGRAATIELARMLSLTADDHVLDLGCGIGGPSRYLANTFGCRVTGLDLTPDYIRVAAMLAERTGLSDKVTYRQGDALAMPFADGSFDVVWSQNVVMNIADRDRLYREVCRVLKPGGRYAFADIVAGNGGPLHYPVPWAEGPSTSFLLSADATRGKLASAGLQITAIVDQTADAIVQQTARTQVAAAPSALGVHILLGPRAGTILKNSIRNFQDGLIGLIQGVATRVT